MEITSGSNVRTEHYHHHFVAHYVAWSLVVIMKVTKCHIIINSSITTHNFLGGVLHTYDDTIWAPGTCCTDDSQDDISYVHSGLRHQPRQRGGREPGQCGDALETDREGTGHQLTWYLDMNLCAKYNWEKCPKIHRNTRRSIRLWQVLQDVAHCSIITLHLRTWSSCRSMRTQTPFAVNKIIMYYVFRDPIKKVWKIPHLGLTLMYYV